MKWRKTHRAKNKPNQIWLNRFKSRMSSKYFIRNTRFRHHARIYLCHRGDQGNESLELVPTSHYSSIWASIAGIFDSKCFLLASEVLDTYPLSICVNRESGRQQLSLAIFNSCFVSVCTTNCCAVYQHFYTMVWQQQTARHPMHNWWMRLARSAAIKIKCNGFCYYVLRNFNDGMFGLLLSNKSLCICMCTHTTNKSQ